MTRLPVWLIAVTLLLIADTASAHEFRPAYLELRETSPGNFSVLWKVPARGESRLGIYVRFLKSCTPKEETKIAVRDSAYTERWSIRCRNGLKGETVAIDGLRTTLTDVLARVVYLNGTLEVVRFTPEQPKAILAGASSSLEIATSYFLLGIEHILLGVDHLLFVLALLLLISDRWALIKTITAFTVAHSITLSGATLGYLSLPQAPVEAAIALSVLFLAVEAAKPDATGVRASRRYPWLMAFSFGLLHGFGFAGVLREIGLPQADVPLALLAFNLGVEAGQLSFVGVALVCLACLAAIRMTASPSLAHARTIMTYAIGTVSAVWLIERLAA